MVNFITVTGQWSRSSCHVTYASHVLHLGRACAQGLLDHLPFPTLVVLPGAQVLLNHTVVTAQAVIFYENERVFCSRL